MFFILIPLSEFLFALLCFLLVWVLISIDGTSFFQSIIQKNATGLFIINFLFCMLFILIILWILKKFYRDYSKPIIITNFCFGSYKTILIAIYFFICNCFIIIPQVATGNLLEIIFNLIGGLFFTLSVLIILLILWGAVFLIQFLFEFVILKRKTFNMPILNFFVKTFFNVIYSVIFYKWIIVKEFPWMFSQTPINLLTELYGDTIISTLEKLNLF